MAEKLGKLLRQRFEPRLTRLHGRITSVPRDATGKMQGYVLATVGESTAVRVSVPPGVTLYPGDEVLVVGQGGAASTRYVMDGWQAGTRPDSGMIEFGDDTTIGNDEYAPGDLLWGNPFASNFWMDYDQGVIKLRDGATVHGALGNLAGLYGYVDTTYGLALGRAEGTWLGLDPDNGIRMMEGASALGQWQGTAITLGRNGQPQLRLQPGTIDFLGPDGAVQATFDGESRTIHGFERLGRPLGPCVEWGPAEDRWGWWLRGENGEPFAALVSGTDEHPDDAYFRVGAHGAGHWLQLRDGLLTWAGTNTSLDADGTFRAANAILTGTIHATGGTVTGTLTAGDAVLDSLGLHLVAGEYTADFEPVDPRGIKWRLADGKVVGVLTGLRDLEFGGSTKINAVKLRAVAPNTAAGENGNLYLQGAGAAGGAIYLQAFAASNPDGYLATHAAPDGYLGLQATPAGATFAVNLDGNRLSISQATDSTIIEVDTGGPKLELGRDDVNGDYLRVSGGAAFNAQDGIALGTVGTPAGITNLADATADTDALNRQTGDGRYLRLDASNDPLTGALTIQQASPAGATLITQAGTGQWQDLQWWQALDGTVLMRFTPDGNLGIGTYPDNRLHVAKDGMLQNVFEIASDTAYFRPDFTMKRSRGTLAAKTAAQNGDFLGRFQFQGNDGVNFYVAAQFGADIDGTVDTGVTPGRLVFATTPAGAGTPVDRLYIYPDGLVYAVGNLAAGGALGIGLSAPDSKLHALLADAATNAVSQVVTVSHNTSGTAAAGYGSRLLWELESSTTEDQAAAGINVLWNDATHATRKADLVLSAYDTAEREGLRVRGAGSAAAIGFLGAAPAAQRAHVANPSGGTLVDSQARTAINAILTTLETFGFHATS